MNGPGFVAALFFWLWVMALGVICVGTALEGHPQLISAVFGVTWVILMTYFAWKIGSSER